MADRDPQKILEVEHALLPRVHIARVRSMIPPKEALCGLGLPGLWVLSSKYPSIPVCEECRERSLSLSIDSARPYGWFVPVRFSHLAP